MQDIFDREFKPKRIIDNPSEKKLREWSLEQGGVITEFGNLAVTTAVRNRIAKFTEVVMGKPGEDDIRLIRSVFGYLKGREMIIVVPEPSVESIRMSPSYVWAMA